MTRYTLEEAKHILGLLAGRESGFTTATQTRDAARTVLDHLAEEPEWAVSVARATGYGDPVIYDFPDRLAAERFIKNPPLWFSREDNQTKMLVSRRKAGPWEPVKN